MHKHHLSSGTISKRWSATKKQKWMERQSAVLDISAANLLARSSFSHLSLSGKPFNSKSFNFIASFGSDDQRFKRREAELQITSWFALKMFLRFLWPPTEAGGIHGSTIKTFHTLSRSRTLPFLSLPTKAFFYESRAAVLINQLPDGLVPHHPGSGLHGAADPGMLRISDKSLRDTSQATFFKTCPLKRHCPKVVSSFILPFPRYSTKNPVQSWLKAFPWTLYYFLAQSKFNTLPRQNNPSATQMSSQQSLRVDADYKWIKLRKEISQRLNNQINNSIKKYIFCLSLSLLLDLER